MKSGTVSTPGLRSSAAPPVCTLAGILSRGAPTPGSGVTPITSTTGSPWASAGAQAAQASIPSNRLVEARNVVGQVLDVLLADRLGNAGHVARVVGARAGLERLQLPDHVLGVLARDARDLVLALHPSQVAHGAQDLVGLLLAARDALRIGLERDRLRILRREVVGEVEHVVARELLEERRHQAVAAPALLEVLELQVDVARGLPGEDRVLTARRVAVGAVAGDAGPRFLLARRRIGVGDSRSEK